MSALILVIIYIAFIAVGIPDSLTGAAWPAIYPDLGVPEWCSFIVPTLIYGSVVVSSILSVNALQKLGTAKTTAFSAVFIASGIIGISFSPSLWIMCLFAVVIGIGSGAINTGLNNYVALHYHARHMNYLHCSYGIGTMCSTSLLAITLERSGWRAGYRYVFIVQAVIALMLFLTIPLWGKEKDQTSQENEEPEKLTIMQMAKNPSVRTTWFAIFATNGIECAAATYLSTYLVDAKGVSEKWGALAATLYFAGLALGRFLSGLISKKIKTWTRIFAGTVIVAVAIAAMFIPAVPVIIGAMFLIGFGNGSIYPNLIHLTPHNFEKKHSGSIMSTEIAVAYMGVMAAPAVMGLIMIWTGVKIFPVYMLFLLVLMIVSLLRMTRLLKKDGKFDKDV